MNDEQLLEYYLSMKESEAYEWNSSPQSLYLEYITREYISSNIQLFEGMEVCNVGIGVGEWDDYLGYLLKDKGRLTSIDIDMEICKIFAFRQKREGHPNPARVVNENILDVQFDDFFDLVTIIGSTLKETNRYEEVLDKCFRMLKDGGFLMYMDFEKYHSAEWFEEFLKKTNYKLVHKIYHDRYENLSLYIFFVKK